MNVLTHWAGRWSQLCKVNGHWRVHVPGSGPEVHVRPIHWWSPRDLIRFPFHWYWVRKFW